MMSEVRAITSAATFKRRPEVDTLGQNNLLSVFESPLSPVSIICALWAVNLYFADTLYAPCLILAVMVFALSYPGRSRLKPTLWMCGCCRSLALTRCCTRLNATAKVTVWNRYEQISL
jgi:hypothetical protein